MTMKELENQKMYKQMCFYLPSKHQAHPPEPLGSVVTIRQFQERTVLVRQFGGYATKDWMWMKECSGFAAELSGEESADADFSQCITAGYDSPMKFWNRRNE